MTVDGLTCQELVELVTEYLEGTMPADQRSRFEAHLAGCPGCRSYLEQLRQTVRLLGKLREEDIPEPACTSLLHTFRDWKQQP